MKNNTFTIKQVTRGGQTLIHNFRMIKQIIERLMIFSICVFISLTLLIGYESTNQYDRYITKVWLKANVMNFMNSQLTEKVVDTDGSIVHVKLSAITKSDQIHQIVMRTFNKGLVAAKFSALLSIVILLMLGFWLNKRGRLQSENITLRGDDLVEPKILNKLIKQSKKVSDISISGLYLPKDFEVRHVFVHGTIGSGKSVFIKNLLDHIRARGDRAIIYDKGCDYIRTYYRQGNDIILNPLDNRTASWHLWDECRDFSDYDSMAAALMPMPGGSSDPFWINAARTIFAATARQMQPQSDRSIINLLKTLLTADLATMSSFLRGTEAEILVSEKIEKTAISIKSVLVTCLKSLRYVKDEANPFSIRSWIMDDTQSNWLFISSLADRHETLKPLITLWLDIAVNALMSLPPSRERRIWIILDELPTLNKLPYLINALAESRKFGGCLVAGVQSISQLREIYGFNGAEGIASLCNSKWFLRSPSFETANWVSKELGNLEAEEIKEGISYGESSMRSGISLSKQQINKQVVSPSEIMGLKDLEAYVRLPGGYPITKLLLTYKDYVQNAVPFEVRKIEERNLNDLNKLIESSIHSGTNMGNRLVVDPDFEANLSW